MQSNYSVCSISQKYHTVRLCDCRDITGRLTMQTCLDLPEDPIF